MHVYIPYTYTARAHTNMHACIYTYTHVSIHYTHTRTHTTQRHRSPHWNLTGNCSTDWQRSDTQRERTGRRQARPVGPPSWAPATPPSHALAPTRRFWRAVALAVGQPHRARTGRRLGFRCTVGGEHWQSVALAVGETHLAWTGRQRACRPAGPACASGDSAPSPAPPGRTAASACALLYAAHAQMRNSSLSGRPVVSPLSSKGEGQQPQRVPHCTRTRADEAHAQTQG